MVEKRKNTSTPWKDSIKLDSNKIAKITVILNLNLMFPVTLIHQLFILNISGRMASYVILLVLFEV